MNISYNWLKDFVDHDLTPTALRDLITSRAATVDAVEALRDDLKPFVVARVNYTRFSKATSFDYDEALDRIIASAAKFNVDRVKQEDVAKAGGGAPEEDG